MQSVEEPQMMGGNEEPKPWQLMMSNDKPSWRQTFRFAWTVQNILDSFFIFPKGHDIVLTQPTFSCGKKKLQKTLFY